jgi:hypothetical protein
VRIVLDLGAGEVRMPDVFHAMQLYSVTKLHRPANEVGKAQR